MLSRPTVAEVYNYLADRSVTNGEYLQFMEDGGYSQSGLWLSDDWQAVHTKAWRAPLYWELVDGEWREMTLGGLRPLDPPERWQFRGFRLAEDAR